MARDLHKLSPVRELALANWRELVRDPSGLFLTIGFPFLFFGLMFVLEVSSQGSAGDLTKMMFPFTLFICYTLLGFYTLGYQTVQLRQKGTLRLLGLTPLRRLTFVLAQLPARLLLAVGQLLLIAATGCVLGMFDRQQWPGVLLGGLLGIGLTFSCAYFIGGLFRSPEAAVILPMALLPLVMFSAGVTPLDPMPVWLQHVGRYSPFTYWLDLMNHWLIGTPLQHPLSLSLAVILGTTLAMTVATVWTFRWDQGEN